MKPEGYMTLKEAADHWSMSTNTLKKYAQEGYIESIKVGKTWLVKKDQPKPEKQAQAKKVASTTIEQYTIKPHVLAWMIREAEAGNPVWQERLELMRVNPHYSETVTAEPWFHREEVKEENGVSCPSDM